MLRGVSASLLHGTIFIARPPPPPLRRPPQLRRPSSLAHAALRQTTVAMASISQVDEQYPGTAVERMLASRERARSIAAAELNKDWPDVRVAVLSACGLRDLRNVPPGQGNTSHCFADFNHCDCTTMLGEVSMNQNHGQVQGIARGNLLGPGIKTASDPELGTGGSWCTCIMGAGKEPPSDVAHLQFASRIAFKLVWSPKDDFQSFVLVDDEGALLNKGTPTGQLPPLRERQMNYQVVQGSKYATAADSL
jgi:hypothetical protein